MPINEHLMAAFFVTTLVAMVTPGPDMWCPTRTRPSPAQECPRAART
ncbi:hypothetical protein [Actinomadura harenae]|nr:hypothetical protein [Actinomadura harenae]